MESTSRAAPLQRPSRSSSVNDTPYLAPHSGRFFAMSTQRSVSMRAELPTIGRSVPQTMRSCPMLSKKTRSTFISCGRFSSFTAPSTCQSQMSSHTLRLPRAAISPRQ